MGRCFVITALIGSWICLCPLKIDAQTLPDPVQENLRNRIEAIETPPQMVVRGEPIYSAASLATFYQLRTFLPAWSKNTAMLPQANSLINALRQADREGLIPTDYHLVKIEALLTKINQNQKLKKAISPDEWVDLDFLLTDAFLVYGFHLSNGRINPETIHPEWYTSRQETDLVALLQNALDSNRVEQALTGLLPPQSAYQRLRSALVRYRKIAVEGDWPTLPKDSQLKKGDRGISECIWEIKLNMERRRWLPHDLGQRYILVNIADFRLNVIEKEKVIMTMKVVVGKPFQNTPTLSSKMTYIVLNPYWYVPRTIAIKDILPIIQKDPDYLTKQQLRVFESGDPESKEIDPQTIDWSKITPGTFSYRFRQEPGPMNVLGRIKFMFPNEFAVYLHDTPSRELFFKTERGFSHGCIRIEKPIELAEYLLKDAPKWEPEKLLAAIDRGIQETIKIPKPIAIHLVYWTAWVDEDGTVQFRKDIYGHDDHLKEAFGE